ncbi:hypothetical protein BT96DRAFT_938135 [Gymnopus androsaceus JB14]|uniref:Uncharacterized protein n=1 Tax=Gymnopus androsaceus JB14 TaxID=1447944 RepID=A0A6A4HTP3_9AGAR|nr:hypothetical protein BT96DRAFT_938135 [Gymnopus androsaceus JB14]
MLTLIVGISQGDHMVLSDIFRRQLLNGAKYVVDVAFGGDGQPDQCTSSMESRSRVLAHKKPDSSTTYSSANAPGGRFSASLASQRSSTKLWIISLFRKDEDGDRTKRVEIYGKAMLLNGEVKRNGWKNRNGVLFCFQICSIDFAKQRPVTGPEQGLLRT